MSIIAWLGSFLLAVCGFPQAFKSYKDKNSNGLSWGFLICWFFGEILALIYTVDLGATPLIFNYIINLASLVVILYYKIKPKVLISIANHQPNSDFTAEDLKRSIEEIRKTKKC